MIVKNNDWVRVFAGFWIVVLTILGFALDYWLSAGYLAGFVWWECLFPYAGGIGLILAAGVILFPLFTRWEWEHNNGNKEWYKFDPIPWWVLEAIAWHVVLFGAVLGAWQGYTFGPWIGAVGGFVLGTAVTYGVVLVAVWVWGLISLYRFFLSMTQRRGNSPQPLKEA